MYVVDITRDNFNSDMLIGNDSMSAKNKTINYITDYVFANYNINLNKDLLDQNLNISRFSLKQFLNNNYNLNIDTDLKIQTFPTDKEHCLFVKYIDGNNEFPLFYSFNKKDIKKARALMVFLINDTLINRYKDNLEEYERLKIHNKMSKILLSSYMPKEKIDAKIIDLDYGNNFLKILLNNDCSLYQLKYKEKLINKNI